MSRAMMSACAACIAACAACIAACGARAQPRPSAAHAAQSLFAELEPRELEPSEPEPRELEPRELEPRELEPRPIVASVDAGPIDRTDFEQALAQHRLWITRCHEATLDRHPEIGGWLDLMFTIGATGFVVTTSWAAVDNEVAACLSPIPGSLHFPRVPPGEVVVVHYPFLFIPRRTRPSSTYVPPR